MKIAVGATCSGWARETGLVWPWLRLRASGDSNLQRLLLEPRLAEPRPRSERPPSDANHSKGAPIVVGDRSVPEAASGLRPLPLLRSEPKERRLTAAAETAETYPTARAQGLA
jgi:hypothetical protein